MPPREASAPNRESAASAGEADPSIPVVGSVAASPAALSAALQALGRFRFTKGKYAGQSFAEAVQGRRTSYAAWCWTHSSYSTDAGVYLMAMYDVMQQDERAAGTMSPQEYWKTLARRQPRPS